MAVSHHPGLVHSRGASFNAPWPGSHKNTCLRMYQQLYTLYSIPGETETRLGNSPAVSAVFVFGRSPLGLISRAPELFMFIVGISLCYFIVLSLTHVECNLPLGGPVYVY